ncbi:MAG: hypothetical protein JWM98_1823 [Thermoleophilia bacterium]|nr:hypothetical protein [Thermoleophilia bacterium]
MGRSLRSGKQAHASGTAAEEQPWWEGVAGNARAHGALPYVVEGFQEISDAVRRGHAVLVRREQVEVSEGMTVFADGATPVTGAFSPISERTKAAPPIVAILRFDVSTARFVLQDAGTPAGAVQLTPRRLARYLDAPDRSVGVALGA